MKSHNKSLIKFCYVEGKSCSLLKSTSQRSHRAITSFIFLIQPWGPWVKPFSIWNIFVSRASEFSPHFLIEFRFSSSSQVTESGKRKILLMRFLNPLRKNEPLFDPKVSLLTRQPPFPRQNKTLKNLPRDFSPLRFDEETTIKHTLGLFKEQEEKSQSHLIPLQQSKAWQAFLSSLMTTIRNNHQRFC